MGAPARNITRVFPIEQPFFPWSVSFRCESSQKRPLLSFPSVFFWPPHRVFFLKPETQLLVLIGAPFSYHVSHLSPSLPDLSPVSASGPPTPFESPVLSVQFSPCPLFHGSFPCTPFPLFSAVGVFLSCVLTVPSVFAFEGAALFDSLLSSPATSYSVLCQRG